VLLNNAVQFKIEHHYLCVTQYAVQLTMQRQNNRCIAQQHSSVHSGSPEQLYCSITQSIPQWNSRTAVLLIAVQSTTELENRFTAQKRSPAFFEQQAYSPHNSSSCFPATSISASSSTTSLLGCRPTDSHVRMRPAVHDALFTLLSTVPSVCAPSATEVSASRTCGTAGERDRVGPSEPVPWRLICVVSQHL